jgi:hypothetical protein
MYLVFSQEPVGFGGIDRLVAHAERFFGSKLEMVERSSSRMRVRLSSARPLFDAEFTIGEREAKREDVLAAKSAEARGHAAGMSSLAEKCRHVWELEAHDEATSSEAAYLTLAAVCASVALGPVLPPDHSTLFGVRGALERRNKLV